VELSATANVTPGNVVLFVDEIVAVNVPLVFIVTKEDVTLELYLEVVNKYNDDGYILETQLVIVPFTLNSE
jgi:hypothetical protein